MSPRATVCVDSAALAANLARVRELAAPARVMVMLKANAYGHGLEAAAAAFANADAFAVASLDEAECLRGAGHAKRTVWLTGPRCADDLAAASQLKLDLVIHHPEQVDWLLRASTPAPALWLKLETGMHRLGLPLDDVSALHARLAVMKPPPPEICLMSHFARAEDADQSMTAAQLAAFHAAIAALPGPRSLCNSPGLLGWPDARADWIRVGGLLYGLSLLDGKTGADHGMQPAMHFTAPLIAIKQLAPGDSVGYGATWRAEKPTRLGIIAAGYGDGYPRSAKSGTPVRLRGKRVPLIGRVSMNYLTVDLNTLPDATIGDTATLFGPELPAEILATHADTIAYELTCRAGAANVRKIGDRAAQPTPPAPP